MRARLTGKAQLGFDHERHALGLQAIGQGLPVGALQNQAEVRHGHEMLAHMPGASSPERLSQMQGDLVREKIKVDPGLGRSSLAATQHIAVKTARFVQVRHIEGKMEQAAHLNSIAAPLRHLACRAIVQPGRNGQAQCLLSWALWQAMQRRARG